MKNTCLFYTAFQVFRRRTYVKSYKIQLPVLLFFVVLKYQFLYQQISFFATFYNFIQHLKKDFHHKFQLFKTPSPFNSQNPLSVAKVFCQCPHNYFYKNLHHRCLTWSSICICICYFFLFYLTFLFYCVSTLPQFQSREQSGTLMLSMRIKSALHK